MPNPAGERGERALECFHKRIADLWWKFQQGKPITDQEVKEWCESLKAHYHWALRLSKLESLLDLAIELKQDDWADEIGREIDRLLEGSRP